MRIRLKPTIKNNINKFNHTVIKISGSINNRVLLPLKKHFSFIKGGADDGFSQLVS